MDGDSGGHVSPNNWTSMGSIPPKFVVFESTLNIEYYSSTPT